MSSKLRSTAVALVLALVTTTVAQASPLSFQARGGENFLETAWGWLTSLFLPDETLSGNLSKEGGMMDPNGAKAGGMMDPNDLTTGDESPTSCRGEEGGMMDPNGFR